MTHNSFPHSLWIVMVAFILSGILQACAPPPPVFTFDDGTTQGWRNSAVFDDQGTYYPPVDVFQLQHHEAAQYPTSFPTGDPLADQNGCLLANGGQLGPAMKKIGFPATSSTWRVDVTYTGLDRSTAWQQIKGIEAAIGDMFAVESGHLDAIVFLRVQTGGTSQEVFELDASGQPVQHPLPHGQWTLVTAPMQVPAGAQVNQVVIRIVGDWANYKLYEGGICFDQIKPIGT